MRCGTHVGALHAVARNPDRTLNLYRAPHRRDCFGRAWITFGVPWRPETPLAVETIFKRSARLPLGGAPRRKGATSCSRPRGRVGILTGCALTGPLRQPWSARAQQSCSAYRFGLQRLLMTLGNWNLLAEHAVASRPSTLLTRPGAAHPSLAASVRADRHSTN